LPNILTGALVWVSALVALVSIGVMAVILCGPHFI
jgi:hypothetical protein